MRSFFAVRIYRLTSTLQTVRVPSLTVKLISRLHPLRVILIGGTWVLLQHTGQCIELVGGDSLL